MKRRVGRGRNRRILPCNIRLLCDDMALLEAALGSPEAVPRAVGKPSLSHRGTSPTRSIRLPRELDAELIARSEVEGRKPSEIVRDALQEYLAKAS